MPRVRLAPVRRAYEQIYDQLRAAMFSGELANGERLPSEAQLAAGFGVSRGTVREALRLLLAEGLIRTVPGAGGGSFVVLPTVDHVADFLRRNVELLTLKEDVTLPEFLEARELIELFAVRQAAVRRTDADLAALRATLTPDDSGLSPEEQYLANRRFHEVLIDACGNTLLQIAAGPIFSVLHSHLMRFTLTAEFPRSVCRDHATILDAIEAGDSERATAAMAEHLTSLAEVYRQIWRPRPAADDDETLIGRLQQP
ncbi:FadR/GntR family transcriptional regulator [Conexibacter arvalis]|uniref:DNA-binding FadR family transcriptional regulator n=1 Tax=Conexibacter arvalis TaxID=912552 RepID=A0A840IKC6_9ACTN|nr:FadR/GntR family transcriptional regulator [Conexibacter arvalis]MBB4665226.1 DNA-binding FadR family transcriptional regulator [Conexibacter arvalis]